MTDNNLSDKKPESEKPTEKPLSPEKSLAPNDDHYKNLSQLHPLLSDFEAVEKNEKATFPYKWMVYGGNHWETLIKVVKPRGFTLVKTKEEDHLEEIDFIWRPIQFSNLVFFIN